MACLLLLAGVASAEEWNKLWAEWKAALKRHDQAVRQAVNDEVRARIRHPIRKFRLRLRTYAIQHAGHKRAAPPLIEILRHTQDPEEQLWVMIMLRESHLRGKYLGRVVAALVRINNKESLRTLREIAEGNPDEKIKSAARLGVHECTVLAVGKPAPGPFSRRYRGSIAILTFGTVAADVAAIKDPKVKVVPITDEAAIRRFNAVGRARIFVLDKKGAIAGKDLTKKQLGALLVRLQ